MSGPAKIEEGITGAISFLGNMKYEHYLYQCASSIVLVPSDFEPKKAVSATLIKVKDVYSSLGVLLEHFNQANQENKVASISEQAYIGQKVTMGEGVVIAPLAYVADGVVIGANVHVYPQVYIASGVQIGDNVTLHPGVKIYKNCQIGNEVIIHANAVIGSDGFGFAPQADGSFQKIPQLGNVIIKDRVEIGANTVIDRATMGSTIIEMG